MKVLVLLSMASVLVAGQGAQQREEVTMTIAVTGGRTFELPIELYNDIVPLTAANFRQLCLEQRPGQGYKNSKFHRIIRNFMMQGGDFTRGDGTGGVSIYGAKFEDENFTVKHTGKGDLSMANSGPNTNGSQFFITFIRTPWLDNKHVVFGRVRPEAHEHLDYIEALPTGASDRPVNDITILGCRQTA